MERTDPLLNCPLAPALARRLRESREELVHRWLERIVARVNLDPNRVFPSDELLNHVPVLIDGIAEYLGAPAEAVAADGAVVAKATELGELRFTQGFGVHEILKEYELLGGILFAFRGRTVDELAEPCAPGELLSCGQRLFRAIATIQQVTTGHYLRRSEERIREREERLRSFNRMVSHELKNRIGAIRGAGELLSEEWLAVEQRTRMARMVVENADAMRAVLDDLLALSRMDSDSRAQQHVLLPHAVREAARALRDMAEARGVEIRTGELPAAEVNAAATELILTNYLSNAIKYADPARPQRWVEVQGYLADANDDGADLVIEVRDNGLGVPADARPNLFRRFFRAHERIAPEVEGTGLGLSIVRETAESLRGRVWAEFPPEGGSVFAVAFPRRRTGDRGVSAETGAAAATAASSGDVPS